MTGAGIDCRFLLHRGNFTLDVDLRLPGAGVTVIFGRSGCGKTSLLRCIAGLEKAEEGRLSFRGDVWQDHNRFTPPHRRPLGYVFQEASLFEHLTAGENLRFAARRADRGGPDIRLDRVVELLGIGAVLHRSPANLSGGERQRVAIARALLINPRLLLMDEPLASLDQSRKGEIFPYLEKLKAEFQLPIVYVTHAPDEVSRLADHVVALEDGRVVATGSLAETLNSLDFPIRLGEEAGAVVEGEVVERDRHWYLARVSFPGGSLWTRDCGHAVGEKIRVRVLARDISLSLMHSDNTSIINALPAEVSDIAADEHPGLALVRLTLADEAAGKSVLIARVTRRSADNLALAPGRKVWAQIKSVAIIE